MTTYKFVSGFLLAVVGIAGLTLSSSGTAGEVVSDLEASALIGAAEQARHFVDEDGGCVGTCNQTSDCVKTASYMSGTAGERGTPANDVNCSNCGNDCSVVWPDLNEE